jgi:preprotein translocase SecE subunit
MRRHPTAAPKAAKQRAPRAPAGLSRRPQRDARERRGVLALLRPRWAEEIVSELRKVTWPTRQETMNLTWVVVIVAAAFGVFLGGVDMFFNWAISNTLIP